MFLFSIEKTNRHSIKGIVLFVPLETFFYSGQTSFTTEIQQLIPSYNKVFFNDIF